MHVYADVDIWYELSGLNSNTSRHPFYFIFQLLKFWLLRRLARNADAKFNALLIAGERDVQRRITSFGKIKIQYIFVTWAEARLPEGRPR